MLVYRQDHTLSLHVLRTLSHKENYPFHAKVHGPIIVVDPFDLTCILPTVYSKILPLERRDSGDGTRDGVMKLATCGAVKQPGGGEGRGQ